MTTTLRQKFKYLDTEKSFYDEIKHLGPLRASENVRITCSADMLKTSRTSVSYFEILLLISQLCFFDLICWAKQSGS